MPNVNRRRKAHAPRARRDSEDLCLSCGAKMLPARGVLTLPVNGEEIEVPGLRHMACPSCGEKIVGFAETTRLFKEAVEAYRERHGLLSAQEIREIRERFGLTQAELARLLRLGANTISRWEAGRNVQTGAMDVLLRLIRDVPGSLAYLRDHAA
jgi:HTH-type transcriptional regulator / antitoxin MqsA